MNGKRMAAVFATSLLLGIAGCGSARIAPSTTPLASPPDLLSCLERAGAEVDIRKIDSESRIVEARLPNGDQVYIGKLPSPRIAENAIQTVKRAREEAGPGGIVTASTVARGSILVLAIGREGVDGGVAAKASEKLARTCALRTGARIGRPTFGPDGTQILSHRGRIGRNGIAL
jgi:hypothetical protein